MAAVQGMAQKLIGVDQRLSRIETKLDSLQHDVAERLDQLREEQLRQSDLLQRLIYGPVPGAPEPPAFFRIVLSSSSTNQTNQTNYNKQGEVNMDFELRDDGNAIATLTDIKDSKGVPTTLGDIVPVWTSSDPQVTVNAAPDGLTAAIMPNVNPGDPLATGVIITATATLADGKVITDTNDENPIDVVAGEADTFAISLQ